MTPGLAFVKSQLAAGQKLEPGGPVSLSLPDRDKPAGMEVAGLLAELGFSFVATAGTAAALRDAGLDVAREVTKIVDGENTDAVTALTLIESGEVSLVINTPRGRGARADGAYIRTAAAQTGVALITTVAAARAVARGLSDWQDSPLEVRSLQSVHAPYTPASGI